MRYAGIRLDALYRELDALLRETPLNAHKIEALRERIQEEEESQF